MKERDISNQDVYRRFCIDIGRSVPDFDETDPLDDLKDYTDQCEGNGQLTMEHFAAPPPPLPCGEDVRRTLKCVERHIWSGPFATVIPTDTTPMVGGMNYKVRMLCCWDDKRTCKGCIRKNCPFAHATKLAELYPTAENDLYTVMPCNFAGMKGGCRYHQCFTAHDWNWTVPVFRLHKPDPPIIDEGTVLPEFSPVCNGKKWSLQLDGRGFSEHIEYAVERYLHGCDDRENEDSD